MREGRREMRGKKIERERKVGHFCKVDVTVELNCHFNTV